MSSSADPPPLFEAFRPPLKSLRRAVVASPLDGALALVPRSNRAWRREKLKCEGEIVRHCVGENRMRCAIKSKKVCTGVSLGEVGGAECEDKIFEACVADLREACIAKAKEMCGKAFDSFLRS